MDGRLERVRELLEMSLNRECTRFAREAFIEEALKKVDTLLTAEPEPCEDARELLGAMFRTIRELGYREPPLTLLKETSDACVQLIDSYASQVADKRVEELRAENERLRVALEIAAREFLSHNGMRPEWWISVLDLYGGKSALAATEPKS